MKYWKKHLKAIAILLIVLLSAGVMSVACAQTTQQSKLALDMVLVVDESGSMSAAVNNMHDRYGYRHDAAASLIGLCDAEKSRVALLPFSTNVITTIDGVNELKEIDITSHNDTRRKMLKLLENDGTDYSTLYGYSRKYGGETDLGSALERAVEILVENKSDNHPVIVLLSDGEIEISDSNGGKFIPNRQKIAASEKKYNDAIQTAKENGITIYTVALTIKSKLLRNAADSTDGLYHEISNPEDLPAVFNNIFAHLVGSDVVTLSSENVETGENSYRTKFTIPNLSIAEANILIPVGENGDITVNKPNSDKPMSFNETNCLRYSSTYFTLVKILHPDQTGEWSIDYQQDTKLPAQQKAVLGKISINVIFSYDVIPKFSMKSNSILKTDKSNIDIQFFRPDGEKSNDINLYQGGIKAWMEIYDGENKKTLTAADGSTMNDIPLTAENDRFTTSIVIRDLLPGIRSGDLILKAHFKGDGMDGTAEEIVHVENRAPILTGSGENPFKDKEIHNPTRHDYQDEITQTIDLNQYVTEKDLETVYFDWLEPKGDEILEKLELKDGILTLMTLNKSGSETLRIRAYDDEGAETIIEIPCKITVVRDVISKQYQLKVTSDGETGEKGSDFTYTAKLMNGSTPITDEEQLKLVDLSGLKLKKIYAESTGKAEEVDDITFVRNGTEFTATTKLSENECTYELTGEAKLRDIPIKVNAPGFSRGNNAPELLEGGENPFAEVRIHDPITTEYEEEASADIDLMQFVSDPDHEQLKFEILPPAEGAEEIVTKELKETVLKLTTTDKGGKETIGISATDPEGVAVTFDIPVNVICVRDDIRKDYTLQMILPELMDKNIDAEIEAVIRNGSETIADTDFLKAIDISGMTLEYQQVSGGKDPVEVEWKFDGDKWTAKITTSSVSGHFESSGQVTMRDGDIVIPVSKMQGGNVGNEAPVLNEEYAEGLQKHFEIEPFLWRKLNEDKIEIDLNELFKDSPTDTRDYGAVYLPPRISEEDSMLDAESWFKRKDELTDTIEVSNDGKVMILNEKDGKPAILLYDVDSDGQVCAYLYKEEIISQKKEVIFLLLLILAAIIALIILVTAWYWLIHRKSWTTRHGEVAIVVNNVPKPNRSSFPKRGKADVPLSYLKIAEVGTGELNTQLSAYTRMFKLRAGSNARVYVMREKSKNTVFSMNIGQKPMNKNTKKIEWQPNESMTIKTNPGSQYGTVNIEVRREATVQPMASGTAARKPAAPATPNKTTGINKPRI